MSYQFTSSEKRGINRGLKTPPRTQLLEVSGFRFWLPPVMTESWSVGAVLDPLGAPWAAQFALTAVSLLKFRACRLWSEHGSSIEASNRDSEPNSSPMDGARKPSAQLARNLRSLIGIQFAPALNVVCEP